MRLLSYTNREVIEEARTLIGDMLASEEKCKEFVRTFIRKHIENWEPGMELTPQQYEMLGFWWQQEIGRYQDDE